MQLIRIADCASVPWKNGAGATRELWKLTDDKGQNLIRISIAEISGNQPFSQFPGIDRVIMQLDGPAMDLTIDGKHHRLGIERPLPFAGEAVVACQLNGAGKAHDLNLMCRRDTFCANMTVVTVPAGENLQVLKTGNYTAIIALTPCELVAPVAVTLKPWDALMCDETKAVRTTTSARFAVLTASPC